MFIESFNILAYNYSKLRKSKVGKAKGGSQ